MLSQQNLSTKLLIMNVNNYARKYNKKYYLKYLNNVNY